MLQNPMPVESMIHVNSPMLTADPATGSNLHPRSPREDLLATGAPPLGIYPCLEIREEVVTGGVNICGPDYKFHVMNHDATSSSTKMPCVKQEEQAAEPNGQANASGQAYGSNRPSHIVRPVAVRRDGTPFVGFIRQSHLASRLAASRGRDSTRAGRRVNHGRSISPAPARNYSPRSPSVAPRVSPSRSYSPRSPSYTPGSPEYIPIESASDVGGTNSSKKDAEEQQEDAAELTGPMADGEGGEEPAGNGWAPFIGPRRPWGWDSQNSKKRNGVEAWGKGYDPHNGWWPQGCVMGPPGWDRDYSYTPAKLRAKRLATEAKIALS